MFKIKHIDVNNKDEMSLVKIHKVHENNPFVYRIECPREDCFNTVWPSQMYDVRELPESITNGTSFVCDGCVETWIRMPEFPLDTETLMIAHGATAKDVKKWKDKNEAAKPNNN